MDAEVLGKKPAVEAPPPAMAAPFDDSDTFEHMWARTSTRFGIIAMGLCMAGPITCGFAYLPALFLAVAGTWLGRNGFVGAVDDSATRAYAKVGLITNITALVFALSFGLIVVGWWAFMFLAIFSS